MRREGFSLVEISVVLVVVATMLAGVLPAITESQKSNASSETADRMEAVKQALLTFRAASNRIPCPSDLTLGVNTANFGKEADALGDCKDAAGTIDATFETASNVVAGGVPTKTLGLPDEYAFDGWGRRLVYHVDKRLTLDTTYATTTTGSITVKDGASTPSDRTTTAAYALLSHGPNGHGAYTRANSRFSFGTTNTRELENCDCTNAAAAGTYNATLHQYMNTPNTDPKLTFDDILIYGSRASLDLLAGGGGGGGSTSAISTPWPDAIVCGLSGTTSDYVFMLKVDYQNNGSNGPLYEYDYALTWNKTIAFTDAGAFSSTSGSGAALNSGAQYHPCQGKSISDLTTAGQAIFFKSTGGGGGSSFWADAGSNHINNTNSGSVGIGTATPGQRLSVSGHIGILGGNSLYLFDAVNTAAQTIQSPAVNEMSFSTSGAEKMRILANGNVGIGAVAPSRRLEVASDGSESSNYTGVGVKNTGAGGHWWEILSANTATGIGGALTFYDRTATSHRLTLDASGNVGIGTSGPTHKLDIRGSNPVIRLDDTATGNNSGIYMYEGGTLRWYAYGQNSNDNYYITDGDQSHGMYLMQNNSTWNAISDRRLKTNVRPYSVLDKLDKYRAVSFDWKNGGTHDVGVIAQELYEAFPEVVTKGDDDKDRKISKITEEGVWSAKYEQLGALAMQGVKELNTKVDALAAGMPVTSTAADRGASAAPMTLPNWVIAMLIAPWLPWIGVALFGWPKSRRA